MAKNSASDPDPAGISVDVEALLLAAQERGDESLETGRYVITFKEGAAEEAIQTLGAQGFQTSDARDFDGQAVAMESLGGADALVLPEVGVAIVGGGALGARGLSIQEEIAADSPYQTIEPEYFAFADAISEDYLRGFSRAADVITKDLNGGQDLDRSDAELEAEALGATWGLTACRVPPSSRSGVGIKVAVLDTGFALNHPDFAGRVIQGRSFVGQPVQDLHGHGTHCIGTACGPKAPPGTTPRYGIGYRSQIFAGKVLSNSGSGSSASVLAGMNWAIANRCAVISMSLGSSSPVQAAYTAAGQAALNNGCLIIAAAGNVAFPAPTGAPANSPTIVAVASLDPSLSPSSFSSGGKIEIAAPGRDVFSSVPLPTRYGNKSGTSMATPHVAGCAALWAESNANLRGAALRAKLLSTARALPFPVARVGRGLVQAP